MTLLSLFQAETGIHPILICFAPSTTRIRTRAAVQVVLQIDDEEEVVARGAPTLSGTWRRPSGAHDEEEKRLLRRRRCQGESWGRVEVR